MRCCPRSSVRPVAMLCSVHQAGYGSVCRSSHSASWLPLPLCVAARIGGTELSFEMYPTPPNFKLQRTAGANGGVNGSFSTGPPPLNLGVRRLACCRSFRLKVEYEVFLAAAPDDQVRIPAGALQRALGLLSEMGIAGLNTIQMARDFGELASERGWTGAVAAEPAEAGDAE